MVMAKKNRSDEVLNCISNEFLTVKQIAKKLDISVRMVQKYILRLKKNGLLYDSNIPTQQGNKIISSHPPSPPPLFKQTPQKSDEKIRIHGHQFKIEIIKIINHKLFDKFIEKQLKVAGTTVKIWKKVVEIYCNPQSEGFYGQDEMEAEDKAYTYWNEFISRLEVQFGIVMIKDSHHNIFQVKAHYSHIKNGVAYYYENKKTRLRIFSDIDSKLRMEVDNSFKLHELEFKHPSKASIDSQVMGRYLNDILNNKPALLSELSKGFIKHLEQEHGMELREPKATGKQETLSKPDYFG